MGADSAEVPRTLISPFILPICDDFIERMNPPVVSNSRLFSYFLFAFSMALSSAHLGAQEVADEPIIKDIAIRYVGASTVDESRIRANLSSRTGARFSNEVVEQDIKNLYASGDVEFVRVLQEDVAGGIRLIIEVQTRGILGEVSIVGASAIDTSRIRREVDIKVGDSLADAKLQIAQRNIEELYRKRGFADASVSYEVSDMGRNGYSKVEFQIAEGGRSMLRNIEFDGNTVYSDRELRSKMKVKEKDFLFFLNGSGKIDSAKLDEDMITLERLYQDKGYLNARIDDVQRVRVDEKRVDLHITITEGEVFDVASVSITGNSVMTLGQLEPLLTMKGGGQTYSTGILEKDEKALLDFYGARGYADSQVRTSITSSGGNSLNVIYEVTEGEVSYLGRVNITGNGKTQDRVLRRELAVTPGELYNRPKIDASRRRLENLGYFQAVDFRSNPSSTPGFKDLDITVAEKSTGTVNFGVGFSSIDNLVGFVDVTQSNFDLGGWPKFTGAGQKFRFGLKLGTERRDVVVSLTEPWMFGQRLAGTVEAYYRDLLYLSDYYDLTKYGANFSLRKAMGKNAYVRTGYTIQNLDMDVADNASDIIKEDEGKFTQSEINLAWVYDTRDSVFLPRKGHKIELEGRVSGGFLGGDVDFYGLSASGVQHFNLPLDTIFTVQGRISVVEATNGADHVPIFDREFLGGADSLRGFEYRDAGPEGRKRRTHRWQYGGVFHGGIYLPDHEKRPRCPLLGHGRGQRTFLRFGRRCFLRRGYRYPSLSSGGADQDRLGYPDSV